MKKAFSSLEGNELHFLQSVLRSYLGQGHLSDFKELHALQKINDSQIKAPVVDLSTVGSDDDYALGIQKMTFAANKSRK